MQRLSIQSVFIDISDKADFKQYLAHISILVLEKKPKTLFAMSQILFKQRNYGRLSIWFAGAFLCGVIYSFFLYDKLIVKIVEIVSRFIYINHLQSK